MAAIAMDTGRLLVVHDPFNLDSGLPSTYTLVDCRELGPEWVVARDSTPYPRVHNRP